MQRPHVFYVFIRCALLIMLFSSLMSCGVKISEDSAHALMEKIYKARKSGSFYKEFSYYAKKDFKIVPFIEVEHTLRTVIGSAGRFKSAKHLKTKTSRRNQIGEGLISYMVLSYEATYSKMTIEETYYFLGSSKTPKIVYLTQQL